MKGINCLIILALILLASVNGCRKASAPKPSGYFRIDLPARNYVTYTPGNSGSVDLPVTFEYPAYGKISSRESPRSGPGWFDIDFPAYHARIYLTYLRIKNDLDSLLEENYNLNIKSHISKADAINEKIINIPANRVYGILYDLKGSTATACQFFVTDSTRNYLRGSLYFSAEPNPDSLAPVTEFFREDIIHLIETLKWSGGKL